VRRVVYSSCQSKPTPDQSDDTCRDELGTLQFEEPQGSDTTKGVQSMSRIWQRRPSPVKSPSRNAAHIQFPALRLLSQFRPYFFSPGLDAGQDFPSLLNFAGINASPITNVATKNPVSD